MARSPVLWNRVPNGGTADNPAVYTAIRDSLKEIAESIRLLQGGPATVSAAAAPSAIATPYSNTGPTLVTTTPSNGYAGFRLPHGTAPSSPVNGDMWTTTSGLYAQINGTTVGPFSAATGVYLPLAGGTMTGLLTTATSAIAGAGFNLPHGAAPTTPVNGDLWTTTTGIYVRINGATVGPLSATTGTVTSVTGTSPVASSGGATPAISLSAAYGDTLNPYGSKTANFVLAAPNGSAGVPSFRALAAADIPSLSGTYLPLAGGTMAGAINMNNSDITNVNLLSFNDPGAAEGISWLGGNLWRIYEAPNALTNAAGNLQFTRVIASTDTRLMTLDTSGNLEVTGYLGVGGSPTYPLHVLETLTGTADTSVAFVDASITPSSASTASYAGVRVDLDDTGANLTGSLRGGDFNVTHAGTNTLASAVGVFAKSSISSTGSVSAAFALYASGPSNSSTGVMTSSSGLYIAAQKGTNVTTGYGVYQASSADLNIFVGKTAIGSTTTPTQTLDVTGTGYFSSDVGIGIAPSYRLHVYEADTVATSGNVYLAQFDYRATPAAPSTATYIGLQSSTLVSGPNAVGDLYGAFLYATHNSSSTATGLFGVVARYLAANTGSATSGVALFAATPSITSTGTITNGYGLYVNTQTVAGVTNGYGIYQASTLDKNILAGGVRIGSTTTPTNALDVTGTATVSANFAVDTSTLYVDSTNNRTGLGTTVPQTTLHVDLTGGALDTDIYNNTDAILAVRNAGTGLRLISATGTPTTVDNTPSLIMLTARGTASAATALSSGDYVGRVLWQGIQTAGGRTSVAEFRVAVDAAPGASYVPGRYEFWTTNSVGTSAERMRLDNNGNLTVNSNVLYVDAVNSRIGVNMTPTVALDVTGSAKVTADFTVDTTTFFVDSTNNRIGVGTTTPSVLAHFFQSTTGDAQVRLNNNNAGTAAVMTYLLTNGSANAGLELTGASFTTYPSRLKLYNGAAGGVVMESDNASGFFSVCTAATFPSGERMRIKGDVKTLSGLTSVISLGLSAGSFAGATIIYTIEATDGTNHQAVSGIVSVAIARNTAGTFATGQVSDTKTATSTTSGTLTVTWSAPTGADPSLVQVTATSSLAVSAGYPRIRYTVFRNGAGTLNIL